MTSKFDPIFRGNKQADGNRLVDQNGQSVRLADLTRQRDFVVVAFYVKAFTGG